MPLIAVFVWLCADRRTAKGTEVFVGGLPRSATESTLREVGLLLLFLLVCSLPTRDRRLLLCTISSLMVLKILDIQRLNQTCICCIWAGL